MSAFLGEVMLLGWSETHSGGPKIALALPDAEELDKFKSMTVKKGHQAGQLLACLMVEMRDGEDCLSALQRGILGASAPTKLPPQPPKGGPLSELAGKWCKDKHFQSWIKGMVEREAGLRDLEEISSMATSDEDFARLAVYKICGIGSRAELDSDEYAKSLFHSQIRLPYMEELKNAQRQAV